MSEIKSGVLNKLQCKQLQCAQLVFHLLFSNANAAVSAAVSFCLHCAHFDLTDGSTTALYLMMSSVAGHQSLFTPGFNTRLG